jgi:hypothetical protein
MTTLPHLTPAAIIAILAGDEPCRTCNGWRHPNTTCRTCSNHGTTPRHETTRP